MRLRFVPLLVVGALASGGCAFIDQTVSIDAPRSAAQATGFPIILEGLVDARADRARIGIVKNGYGWETANVVTEDDVPTAVGHALRAELEAAHFSVLAPPASGASPKAAGEPCEPDVVRVGGSIELVMTEPVIGWTGDVVAEVKLVLDVHRGGRVYHREFIGHSKDENVVILGEDCYERALYAAMANASREAVHGLLELLKRPELVAVGGAP